LDKDKYVTSLQATGLKKKSVDVKPQRRDLHILLSVGWWVVWCRNIATYSQNHFKKHAPYRVKTKDGRED